MRYKSKRARAFVSKPRCIYTGEVLDQSSPPLRPTPEHIIPLSLGGSNQFVTDQVCADANNRVGHEIDDAVAQSLPFLMLRHRYQLAGHRKTIPNVRLKGTFIDICAPARLDINDSGELVFEFENEQKTSGRLITLATTQERLRFLLRDRLEQTKHRQLRLITEFGEIKDEEDIEVALQLADRNEGREFKASVTVDLKELNVARARLMVKIALGLGHRVLGREWAFGPGGMILRSHLFPNKKDLNFGKLRGTLNADLPEVIPKLFGIADERHVMAVLPIGKKTVAMIVLFGGQSGSAVIDLGVDSRRLLNKALLKNEDFDCAFSIPLMVHGSRPLEVRSIQQIGEIGALSNFLPESRAAAKREALP